MSNINVINHTSAINSSVPAICNHRYKQQITSKSIQIFEKLTTSFYKLENLVKRIIALTYIYIR